MPNTRPAYRIEANDSDITTTINKHFVSLTITDEAGIKSDTLSIELDDSDNVLQLPATGAQLRVWLGYDDAAKLMGLYVVDEIELKGPPDRLVIKAKATPMKDSKAFSALQTQRNRSWTPRSLADLAGAIAAEHGLSPAVSPSLQDHQLPHLDQVNESNMHLLTRVAKDVGAIAKANGGKLLIVPQGEGKTVSGKTLPVVSMTRQDVTTWGVKIIGRADYKKVVTMWRDVTGAIDMEEVAGSGEPVRRIRHAYPNQDAAQKAAESYLEAFKRGKSVVNITRPGRADIMAECRLQLSGFRSGINGVWSVKRVTHRVSSAGYSMTLDGEVPKK